MATFLDFEKPIAELEARVAELRDTASSGAINIEAEIQKLQERAERLLRETYTRLTPWQKTQVARHPERPHFKHYVEGLIEDFVPLAGDRNFGEDLAIMGGFGKLGGRRVLVIGHEKGDDVSSRLRHNFGMAKPEGYRKAIRLMQLADRFGLPVVSLVDTSGAFPGVQAEERGQAEAIARSTEACLALGVPLVAAIVGEGGSGGAIAIAAANRVLMLEHSVYSVISPEGCASILWRTSERAADAAEAMKMTAADLAQLGVVDRVVAEPVGGAHRSPSEAVKALGARSARSSTRCGVSARPGAKRPPGEVSADRVTCAALLGGRAPLLDLTPLAIAANELSCRNEGLRTSFPWTLPSTVKEHPVGATSDQSRHEGAARRHSHPDGAATAGAPAAQAQRAAPVNEHQQILQQFGGEVQGPLGQLVDNLGSRITAQAGPGPGSTRFHPAQFAVANAFATPSRPVYCDAAAAGR
jgi:acetyl-CoA carboxylase carboxyl transferase subunit alpha